MTAKAVHKRSSTKTPGPAGSNGAGDICGSSETLLGYVRITKGDEEGNALRARTRGATACRKLFEEDASGGRLVRPDPHRLLNQLRDGDTVAVWKLDRLCRSPKDVLRIVERIAKAGAGFRRLTENIDTTTPARQMVGSFAAFERAMIRERTSAGLAVAGAEGRVGGRRKKMDVAKRRRIADNVFTGRKSGSAMARLYNISQPTVSRIVAQHRSSSTGPGG